jgi:hypothetical protein
MVFKRLLEDALTQGTTPLLMKFLNVSIVCLILTMIFAIAVGYGDIHTSVMLFLATGLLASANW